MELQFRSERANEKEFLEVTSSASFGGAHPLPSNIGTFRLDVSSGPDFPSFPLRSWGSDDGQALLSLFGYLRLQ
jgi:hypothetical protein